jgi:hypothetical protein
MSNLTPLSRTFGAFIVLAILNGCDNGKQLNGSVIPNDSSTIISFEYGTTGRLC